MTSHDLHGVQLAELGRIIEANMGWSLAASSPQHLDHSLRSMARHMRLADAGACLAWLIAPGWSAAKEDCCARFMTIGETYFFREQRAFGLIVERARARAADPAMAGTPLRVWSAGCCTGEEPYSAAMALLEAGLGAGAVSILATDISKRNLDAAQAGLYRAWSFRGVRERIRERYFSPAGEGLLQIGGQVRAMVRFAELNLALPSYPSPANGTACIDVILCRNVLMYFTPVQRKLAVQRLRACLADGGWLVVNASEASSELFEGFRATCYPDAIHYQKSESCAPKAARRTTPARAALAAPLLASAPAAVPHRSTSARRAPRPAVPRPEAAAPPTRLDAPAQDADTIAQLRALVAHSIGAGDIERARTALQQIIFLAPLDVAAHYMMGMVLEQSGRLAQGRRKFAVVEQLLQGVDDADCVPGTEGLPAAYLRASVRARLAGEVLQ